MSRILRAMLGSASPSLASSHHVGSGAQLRGPIHVDAQGRIDIGDRFVLRDGGAIAHLVTGPGGGLTIGNDVSIGQGTGIAAHAASSIGDGTTLGEFVLIMDTNFHRPGNWRAAAVSRAITIGSAVTIGDRCVILPGASIGDGATVAEGSVVTSAVAAGARVSGQPARPERAPATFDGMTVERALAVIQRAFGLPAAPAPGTRRREIKPWGLMGNLGLLLDLEAEFTITVPDGVWLGVETVQDVIEVITAAVAQQHEAIASQ